MLRQLLLPLAFFAAPECAVAGGSGVLWGQCNWLDRLDGACTLTSGHKCSDHLSPGPSGSTFELVLGSLPQSSRTRPVHLQWFAAFEALGFNPLAKETVWTVYGASWWSYPRFKDADFNGGNVRVNETGHAVLRFKAPSTYFISPRRIRFPHVHLRLCTGEDYIIDRAETVDLTLDGPVVRGSFSTKFVVHSLTNIAPIPPLSTTATTTSSTTKTTTTMLIETTTLAETTTTGKFLVQSGVTPKADTSFDWDALEFSPVYQCLVEKKAYNYFGSGCVDVCPAHADQKHGQCVRKAKDSEVEFNASWSLQVHCDEACWSTKTPRTRHYLRIAIADHLDITFQEVLKVVLRPGTSSRRLSGSQTSVSDASLLISVKSSRQPLESGGALLRNFLSDTKVASEVLGLEVQNMQLVNPGIPADNLEPGEAKDEFDAIYSEVESGNAVLGPPKTDSSDGLPLGILIGAAVAVFLLGGMSGLALRWKLRRARNANKTVVAKAVEENVEAKVEGKVVEGEKVGAYEDNAL